MYLCGCNTLCRETWGEEVDPRENLQKRYCYYIYIYMSAYTADSITAGMGKKKGKIP